MGRKPAVLAAAVWMVFMTGCTAFNQASTWKDRDITIDGSAEEWQGRMKQYSVVSLGACNDAEYLYLCLESSDQNVVAQLTGRYRQTSTLWFDPAGTTDKAFAIRFTHTQPQQPGKDSTGTPLHQQNQPPPPGEHGQEPVTIEILHHGEVIAELGEAEGVEVVQKTSSKGRKLVCECKIPLITTFDIRHAVQAAPGATISMGIETSAITQPAQPAGNRQDNGNRPPMPGNGMQPPDGDMSRGAPPMGGGESGRGPGMHQAAQDTPDALTITGKIHLAVKA